MGAAVLVGGKAVAVGGGADVSVGATAVAVGGTSDGVAELAIVDVGNGIGVEVVVDARI